MKYSKLILFTLISLLVIDSFRYISWVGKLNMNSATYISAFLQYVSIIILIFVPFMAKTFQNIPVNIRRIFLLWMIWSFFNIVRGVFLANNYWDYKFLLLTSTTFTLISLMFFVGSNLLFAKNILQFTLKYLFVFGFVFIPLALATNEELYSRLMIPISLFIVFIPYLKPKWKILIIIVAITSVLLVIGFRSNIIKIIFSVSLLSIYYLWFLIRPIWIKFAHLLLFIAPILLFITAFTGTYNIFNETSKDENYTTINSRGDEENLLSDTRTFLYVEVLNSLKESGNWLMGESASGSYKTIAVYDSDVSKSGIRYRSEVNILNILLYHGIVGVFLYFLLLYRVSYYAIYRSKNQLSKMLGLFISFRWTLSFIEEFTQYDLNFYFFWLAMGLVSNKVFREMTNVELKTFFRFENETNSRTDHLPQQTL